MRGSCRFMLMCCLAGALGMGWAGGARSQDFLVVEKAIVVQLDDGRVMRGKTTADEAAQGRFAISGGGVTCRGRYSVFSTDRTLAVTFSCNRGVTGSAAVIRTADLQSGVGAVSFSNGWRGKIAFGN
jgi:hypothetical protein